MFNRNDRYLGIGCIALGIAGYISASKWKVMLSSDPAGPGAIPKILCASIAVIGLILLLGSFFMTKKDEAKEPIIDKAGLTLIILLTAICLAYIIILPFVGYLIATPLLLAGLLLAVGYRKTKTIVLISLIGTVVLFALFYIGLKVNLPMGFMKSFFDSLNLRW